MWRKMNMFWSGFASFLMGYLIPKPSLLKDSSGIILGSFL